MREARQIAAQHDRLAPNDTRSTPPKSQAPADSSVDSKNERPSELLASSANYGRDRLIQMLREYEFWDELGEFRRTGYIEPSGSLAEQAAFHANLGIVAYCRGDVAGGDRELAALRAVAR